MKVLLTGAAGFVGAATTHRLLERGDQVIGVDNISNYYEPTLKIARIKRLANKDGFKFMEMDCTDRESMAKLFEQNNFDAVIHLAAQPGVQYSLENPFGYLEANLQGFLTVLEGCRHHPVKHLVYASSSSVYGGNTKMPFAVADSAEHPISLYAATKKSNEQMAHVYAHLFGVRCTGLRFFSVYGPWGRPDMAPFKFVHSIVSGKPITVYGDGKQTRDWTFIDDVVEGVVRALDQPATADAKWDPVSPNSWSSSAPWRVYNIGSGRSVSLLRLIECIEECLGEKAVMDLSPMKPGDLQNTRADISALHEAVGYQPSTPIEMGIPRFVKWYREYYGI